MKTHLFAALTAFSALAAMAQSPSAASLAQEFHTAALNPAECYRVRDLNFSREDLRVYFTEGYLIFAKPVNGARTVAVFSADVEGGDGEVLLLPPTRNERLSLATATKSPNLDEHFRAALLMSSSGLVDELWTQIQQGASVRRVPEAATLLTTRWDPVLRNISSSFEVRMVRDLLSPERDRRGLVYLGVEGKTLGSFDVVVDPLAREQVIAGHFGESTGTRRFEVWTSFVAASNRKSGQRGLPPVLNTTEVVIDATLQPDLTMKATTKLRSTLRMAGERAFSFEIADRMRVTAVEVDGTPAELFSRPSLRDAALRGNENQSFVAVTLEPLDPTRLHEFTIHHEGNVVETAGNGVYFVTSRGTWYPRLGTGFSIYDLTFRYPKSIGLVSSGELVEDRVEGDLRVTRRKTSTPMRMAGFNLGDFRQVKVTRPGYTIEVYGNRRLEPALESRTPAPPPETRAVWPRRGSEEMGASPTFAGRPDPTANLRDIAAAIAGAFDFMSSEFGPAPVKVLAVSPIPGTFGQGFPGLVYLSTLSYLAPQDRPLGVRDPALQTFFSDILQAHETAHQWWGNLVAPESYQDEWIVEALSNYSALLYLEKKKGAHAREAVLEHYRNTLLAKRPDGSTVESAGPIVWGLRLQQSTDNGLAWRTIVYDKGTWIMHMLRNRMGDENFRKMLAEFCRRYRFQTVTTEDFRLLAAEFMPKSEQPRDSKLETFFDNWVYATGIPTLKMSSSVKGSGTALKVSGTVTQTDVDTDFSVDVPVEVQFAKGRKVIWVRTSDEPVQFQSSLNQPPLKVGIPVGTEILAKK